MRDPLISCLTLYSYSINLFILLYSSGSHLRVPAAYSLMALSSAPSDGRTTSQANDLLVVSLALDMESIQISNQPTLNRPPKDTAIFLQDVCLQHRFIRSRDTSAIVEKPERLRAVNVGLAAAIARLELSSELKKEEDASASKASDPGDELAAALERINISTDPGPRPPSLDFDSLLVSVVKSSAAVNLLDHAAVKFIHGDIDGDKYLEDLRSWVRDSHDKISKGGSEIPEHLSQGDLYRKYYIPISIIRSLYNPCSLSHFFARYTRRHWHSLRSSGHCNPREARCLQTCICAYPSTRPPLR